MFQARIACWDRWHGYAEVIIAVAGLRCARLTNRAPCPRARRSKVCTSINPNRPTISPGSKACAVNFKRHLCPDPPLVAAPRSGVEGSRRAARSDRHSAPPPKPPQPSPAQPCPAPCHLTRPRRTRLRRPDPTSLQPRHCKTLRGKVTRNSDGRVHQTGVAWRTPCPDARLGLVTHPGSIPLLHSSVQYQTYLWRMPCFSARSFAT